MSHRYVATCPEEVKAVLAEELIELGARDVKEGFKAVEFSADLALAYEIHLKVRTASRILRVIKEFSAKTPVVLLNQARRIKWSDLISSNSTYLIDGVAGDRGPEAMSSNDISKKVREALQDHFAARGEPSPKVDLKEPKVVFVAYVYGGRCTLSVDTSGKTLHKRGYRGEGHPAPIKETLAASLLRLSGYDGTQTLLDPMCGSGTIAIEAAYIALGKAPLIHRKKGDFGFEWLKDFDRNLWRQVQDKVRGERRDEPRAPIFASDISSHYVAMAKDNALRARVEKHIHFNVASFLDLEPPAPHGILVTNLPYGERLGAEGAMDVKELYQEIGNTLKRRFQGWSAALLAADESPHKFIGLRPKRRIPILNGSIKCKYLLFDLY